MYIETEAQTFFVVCDYMIIYKHAVCVCVYVYVCVCVCVYIERDRETERQRDVHMPVLFDVCAYITMTQITVACVCV